MSKNKTFSTNMKYTVELFPVDGTSDPVSTPPLGVFGNFTEMAAIKSTKQLLSKDNNTGKPTSELTVFANNYANGFGINALSFSRSKSNPSSECNFSVAGPVHKDIRPGTWVVVTGLLNSGSDEYAFRKIVKFVGQIYHMSTSFRNQGSGLLSTVTNVAVREWSHVLTVPIRYDVYSIFAESLHSKNPQSAVIGALSQKFGKTAQDQVEDILIRSFDPFGLANAILTLVGMLSDYDSVIGSEIDEYKKLPSFSTRTPQIPETLKNRLKLNLYSSGNTSYTQGFVRVATGPQLSPIHNNDNWDGVFEEGGIDKYIDTLKKGYETENVMHPSVNGGSVLTQIGMSAWDLINQYCNGTYTEVFTDMLYVNYKQDSNIEDIVAQPVVVVRDKPFLLKKFDDVLDSNTRGKWTLYDNLPRINIDSAAILEFSLSNNCVTSPNYIRGQFDSETLNKQLFNSVNVISSNITVMDEEMNMFGGQEMFMKTYFIENDQFDAASSSASKLGKYWHGYLYKMFDGSIVIKEDGSALTVGMNIQFKIGAYTVVGHIENISTNFSIDMSGMEQYVTTLSLTRIVQVNSFGELDFIPIEDMSNLPFTKEAKTDLIDAKLKGASSIFSKIGSFLA